MTVWLWLLLPVAAFFLTRVANTRLIVPAWREGRLSSGTAALAVAALRGLTVVALVAAITLIAAPAAAFPACSPPWLPAPSTSRSPATPSSACSTRLTGHSEGDDTSPRKRHPVDLNSTELPPTDEVHDGLRPPRPKLPHPAGLLAQGYPLPARPRPGPEAREIRRLREQRMRGKNIAVIFEKTSTRTRVAFEVAAYDQGAHVTYLGPSGTQIGEKESMKDTARVLGRIYDGIEYRGFGQEIVDELADNAGVPVWNGLTDEFHPTQILADFLTMQEFSDKPLHDISYCFLGDGRFNMGNSLLIGGSKMGMDVRICAPKDLWPQKDLLKQCKDIAKRDGRQDHHHR